MDCTAILLAGGLGTRLRSVVADRPKVLATVAGRPFLTYLLDQLQAAGIRQCVVSTGYLAEQFHEVLGAHYGQLKLRYAREDQPLGTGGAVKWASRLVETPEIVVMNGDSFVDARLADLLQWHRSEANDVSLLLVGVADASRYGTVRLDADQRVVEFVEKQPGAVPGLINAGVYVLGSSLLERIPAGKCSLEVDVLPGCLQDCRVRGFVTQGEFIDIGIPDDYGRSHEVMERLSGVTR